MFASPQECFCFCESEIFGPISSWISNKILQYFTGYLSQENPYFTRNLTYSLIYLLDFLIYFKTSTGYPTKFHNTGNPDQNFMFLVFPKLTARYLLNIQRNVWSVSLLPDIQGNTCIFNVFFALQLDIYSFGTLLLPDILRQRSAIN